MKIFNISKRINLSENDSILGVSMEEEYGFYQSICKNYNIKGKDYKVSKVVNYQCRMSLACNADCPFCIEKDSCRKNEVTTDEYVSKLNSSLVELHKRGINPTVTITGGEPCLFKDKLFGILRILNDNNIYKFNVNTNGILLDKEILDVFKKVKMPHLNISLHHYDLSKNKEIFSGESITKEQVQFIKKELGATYYDATRVRLQCVLIKGYVDNLEEVKKFLDFAIELGFDNVAFRGLSKLKEVGINPKLHRFCKDNSMEIFDIVNKLPQDNEFKFNCQNISDHYMYEDWVYKGKVDVHFAYSDMDILEKREKSEIANNINYAREFVLYEDGAFCGGWNRDIKRID